LKGIVNFKPFHVRVASLKSLFYFHRDCKETWYYLLQQFKIEEDEAFQLHLISIMRFLIGHGDIFWHKDNFIPDEIEDYARNFIKKYYGFHEVDKLLRFIGEGGITRGTIGQDIYPLIQIIPNKLQILEGIVSDITKPEVNRYWATIIAINYLQYKNPLKAIAFIDKVKTIFSHHENLEMLEAIKETIKSEGFMDFYG
jgi:hypothetical protein